MSFSITLKINNKKSISCFNSCKFKQFKICIYICKLGVTNTVGRIFCGWLSDKEWADPLKIYNCALIIGGTVTMCCTWLQNFYLLCLYAAVFGFCVGKQRNEWIEKHQFTFITNIEETYHAKLFFHFSRICVSLCHYPHRILGTSKII